VYDLLIHDGHDVTVQFMDAFGSIINRDGSMTQDQIARLFMQIDANSDGGIDWNEFSTC
jgi:hypothetical protein